MTVTTSFQAENLKPFEIAIDRPSPKFLGFLRKHYKLQSYVRQICWQLPCAHCTCRHDAVGLLCIMLWTFIHTGQQLCSVWSVLHNLYRCVYIEIRWRSVLRVLPGNTCPFALLFMYSWPICLMSWPLLFSFFFWFVDVSHKSRRNSLQKNEPKATLLSSTSNITTKSPPGKMVEWLGSFNTQSQPPQKLTPNKTETGERKGIPGSDNDYQAADHYKNQVGVQMVSQNHLKEISSRNTLIRLRDKWKTFIL